MPQADRVRSTALMGLAATAATAAVGVAALARAGAGLCDRRLLGHHHAATAMAHHAGMTMPVAPAEGVCPILVYAGLVAAALCLFALGALVAGRARPGPVAAAAARLVLGLRLGRLTALLGLAGGVPLAAISISEQGLRLGGPAALAALAALAGGALLAALALVGTARALLALTRRLVGALAAAFRLLVPGADAPWAPRRALVLAPAGVRLARRRPSRAPPVGV